MSEQTATLPFKTEAGPHGFETPVLSQQETFQLLRHGQISDLQLSRLGSNYTFLVKVDDGSRQCRAVYKPRDGEAPLWDFPSGTLYKREYAAYLFSQILGWDFIPLTIIRDGPYGVGSLQLFVEHDPRINYFSIRESESESDALRVIACFDLAANNTDRKASHCIQGDDGKIWGIDHGLTFHSVVKVRTTIWDFAGEPIPDPLLNDLSACQKKLKNPRGRIRELVRLLLKEEVTSLDQRIAWLLDMREYPGLGRQRR